MKQVVYFITKEDELIFAQNFKYDTKAEAEKAIKNTYENVKTQDNIKDIQYVKNKLVFTDTAENDSDEIHTMLIK